MGTTRIPHPTPHDGSVKWQAQVAYPFPKGPGQECKGEDKPEILCLL